MDSDSLPFHVRGLSNNEIKKTMFNPFLHVVVILISLIITLLPLTSDDFLSKVRSSDLVNSIKNSKAVTYSIIASISIAVPLAFDFVLDIIETAMSVIQKRTDEASRWDRLVEFFVRFFCMSALVTPNLVLVADFKDYNEKIAFFVCFAYWRDIALCSAILFVLGQRDSDIWDSRNTLILSITLATAFLLMENNVYVKSPAMNLVSAGLLFISTAYFVYLFFLTARAVVKKMYSPVVPSITNGSKHLYLCFSYACMVVLSAISLLVRS